MEPKIFSSLEIDAIGEILNISLGASATAVSTMLSKRVDITIPTVLVSSKETFEFSYMEPAVGVEITYVTGLSGKNIMLLKRHDVKVIVEILMGTEIPEDEFELNEINMSAVCEVMNQMMGASSTALSELLGEVVNISTPTSYELNTVGEFKEKYFSNEDLMVVVKFVLKVEDVIESEFLNIMSVDLAKRLLSGAGFAHDDSHMESQPAAEPAAAQPSSGATLSQEEIERLLLGGVPSEPETPITEEPSSGGVLSQDEIEKLLSSTVPLAEEKPVVEAPKPAPIPAPTPAPAPAPPVAQEPSVKQEPKVINVKPMGSSLYEGAETPENLDLIMDVPLEISVEIGRTKKHVKEILGYNQGSLVVLDKLAGEQVDVFVNGQCIAKGDVVVVDDCFGVRITEVLKKF